jgi:hypothetical protein
MEEQVWLTTDESLTMLHHLGEEVSSRKLRLYLAACGRRIERLLPQEESRWAIEIAERMADGEPYESEASANWHIEGAAFLIDYNTAPERVEVWINQTAALSEIELRKMLSPAAHAIRFSPRDLLVHAAYFAHSLMCSLQHWREQHPQSPYAVFISPDLLRDIFGNPFGPSGIDSDWLTWNNRTVPKLAQTIYDDRRYDIMPILADALEEAGCIDLQILDHCRGPGPHVRGCWVVDLILGKT